MATPEPDLTADTSDYGILFPLSQAAKCSQLPNLHGKVLPQIVELFLDEVFFFQVKDSFRASAVMLLRVKILLS